MLTMSACEAEALTGTGGFDLLEHADPDDRALLARHLKVLMGGQRPVRLAEPDFDAALQRVLGRLAVSEAEGINRVVIRYFAQRHPDWIVPFGYAAADVLQEGPAAARRIAARVNSYAPKRTFGSTNLVSPDGPLDMIEVMRLADEASDLAGMAHEVRDLAANRPAADRLAKLIGSFEAWRKGMEEVVLGEGHNGRSRERAAPTPPPITVADDPQKNRWGGLPERDGRRLGVTLTGESASLFDFDIFVESMDGSPLEEPVIFHLHSSFPRSTISVRRIRNGRATLFQVVSYVMFTIGAQVKRADGGWTSLELDLLDVAGIPERFHGK
jgi:hypothetical protein